MLFGLGIGCPTRPFDDAKVLEAKGALEEAAREYREVAKRDPANLEAWDKAVDLFCTKLALVDECMGTLDLELDLLGDIKRHVDRLAEVLESRARARLDQGLPRAALADIQRALKFHPTGASLFALRGRIYLSIGEAELAERALRKAIEIDPRNSEATELLGSLPSRGEEEGFGGALAKPPESHPDADR